MTGVRMTPTAGSAKEAGLASGVLGKLIAILEDMIQDWGLDLSEPMDASTRLMDDLGFASIDLVALIAAIDEEWQRRDWPYERLLMLNGRYVEDLTVGAIADFIWIQGAR